VHLPSPDDRFRYITEHDYRSGTQGASPIWVKIGKNTHARSFDQAWVDHRQRRVLVAQNWRLPAAVSQPG